MKNLVTATSLILAFCLFQQKAVANPFSAEQLTKSSELPSGAKVRGRITAVQASLGGGVIFTLDNPIRCEMTVVSHIKGARPFQSGNKVEIQSSGYGGKRGMQPIKTWVVGDEVVLEGSISRSPTGSLNLEGALRLTNQF